MSLLGEAKKKLHISHHSRTGFYYVESRDENGESHLVDPMPYKSRRAAEKALAEARRQVR